jgi:carbamoyl-phosphate synthase large subunit
MSFTLLITCVGGELSPQVIQGLQASQRHDVTIIGVDNSPEAVGRHFVDHFATVPRGDDPGYVESMRNLIAAHDVDLILPTSDEEALALVADRAQIEIGGCRLACAAAEVLDIVSDKVAAYERLAELDIAVPEWRKVANVDELEAAVTEMYAKLGDVVVKPAVSRGGRNISVIRGDAVGATPFQDGREVHMDLATFRSQYVAHYAELMPSMVMQRLVEPVFDIDMLAWNGKAERVVARRRVDSALPNEGHTIVDDPELIELGHRLIRGLNLSWLYDCDVMYGADGRPGILEINPRPSGSIATTIAAGVPLLEDMISLAKGEPLPTLEVPFGSVVVPFKSLAVVQR